MILHDYILSNTGFEKQMLSYIDKIDANCYDFKKGNEGFAYFISDDLVLKEFRISLGSVEEYIFENYFEAYCKEIQGYNIAGLAVPKIFAWCSFKTPEKRAKSSLPHISYYILEERAKGRELYYPQIEEFYENFQNQMSFEEYQIRCKFPDRNNGIEIYQRYFSDYIIINKCLESMPEKDIEKFILDAYNIYLNSNFSEPDLFSTNVFYDGKGLNIIDQKFVLKEKNKYEKVVEQGDFMLNSLVNMFLYNAQVQDYFNDVKSLNFGGNIDFNNFYVYVEKNQKESSAAMLKFLKILKKCVDGIKLPETEKLKKLRKMLVRMIGKHGTDNFLNEIEKK